MKRERFTPKKGQMYKNEGGGTYFCMDSDPNGTATMQNVLSGWTLTAHGCNIYENGKIDWDYSTNGRFA